MIDYQISAMSKFLKIIGVNNPKDESNSFILYIVLFSLVVTTALMVFLGLSFCKNWAYVLSNFFIVVLALTAVGFLLGFIFGIPRSVADRFNKTMNKFDTENQSDQPYADNTNLEEISDWITKIIVGLALIKFRAIFSYISLGATQIAESFPTSQNMTVFSHGMIYFYFTLGFLWGYFWTRTRFGNMLVKSKIDRDQIMRIANENLSAYATPSDGPRVMENDSLFSLESLLLNKPILYNDDTQKGRWGSKSENKGFRIQTKVTAVAQGLFELLIEVTAFEPDSNFKTDIIVFLDRTFPTNTLYLKPTGRTVSVKVIAYEAFTIGALVNNEVELELDLQRQQGYPKEFYY
ncbi:hypothetical protein SAMN06298216_1706 [Spirosomataceae bacterium TFI 002]|nr:hypothetical protein SAMN06298216_1706 [Spirosomataceae bacterium TFI 002]